MRVTVITDASFCPDTFVGGWAAWIAMPNGIKLKRYGALKENPLNSTDAEFKAAINGIVLAVRQGATNILLQSDCINVVKAINEQEVKLSATLAENSVDVSRIKLIARHVKGHTVLTGARYFVNRWCDKMAKLSMREKRDELSS